MSVMATIRGVRSAGSPRRARRTAFTLMETLLAVSLSATLVVFLAAAMNLYSKVVSDRRTDVANAQVARLILHRFAADLRAAYYSEQPPTETAESEEEGEPESEPDITETTADPTGATVQPQAGLFGNQYELQMDVLGRFPLPVKYDSMVSQTIDPITANLTSDPKTVTYFMRPTTAAELDGTPLQSFNADDNTANEDRAVLIRRVQNRARALYSAEFGDPTSAMQGEQFLTDQIASIEFMYFDGVEWLDAWDSTLMGGLPTAVQITIVVLEAEEASAMAGLLGANSVEADNIYQLVVTLPTAKLASSSTSF